MISVIAFGGLLLITLAGALFGVAAGVVVSRLMGATGGKVALIAGGVAVGGLLLGLFAGIVHYSHVRKAEAEARSGWNLVPIVVAATDISRGEAITFDVISQRSIPEQFAPAEVVRPDEAPRVIGRPTSVALKAGDFLYWSAVCGAAR